MKAKILRNNVKVDKLVAGVTCFCKVQREEAAKNFTVDFGVR